MKALEGIKILDFTHVQSGPTCTQLLAWFGADVLKVERPGVGDATRKQLVDVPGADSLYFTMLNHNKRSIELDSKSETGKEVLTRLIEECDVLVENFAPGALDRMGFSWERIQEINPRLVLASIKGLRPRTLRGLQGLRERRAVRRGLGLHDGLPRRPRRSSPAPSSATRARGCTSRSASSRRCSSARRAAGARRSPARCRTAC